MIKKIYKKYEIIFNVVLFSIFPIAAFYLMEFYEHNPFEEVRFMAGFFNIILFELIAWILYFITVGISLNLNFHLILKSTKCISIIRAINITVTTTTPAVGAKS
jgi:hypothetical protein